MRLLVFGHSGQVATELRALAGPDLEIIALGRAAADLDDPEACAAAVAGTAAEAVINAAAFTAVDRAETEEEAATRINAAAPAAMARAAAAQGTPFLHISTDYVFSGAEGPPWREEDPPGPLSAYGRSKLAGERAVMAANPQAVILRTAWVFSAHGGNFVRTMLRLGAERDHLRVVDDQIGGPTPAAAIAAALVAIARARVAGAGAPGLFHFIGSPAVSWCGFAHEIMARAGLSTPVEAISTAEFPTPARRPANAVLDCSRIAAVYGLAQPDWRDGLDAVLAALKPA